MDEHDVIVSIVVACMTANASDAAADALRVADRIVAMFELDDVAPGNIRVDALLAVRAAIVGEPDPITRYGINMRVPDVGDNHYARIHATVADMLNQTRGWGS